MDTVKWKHGNTRMIAHRGASSLETENTMAAFVAAGNRTYFGIETDVHVTKDGQFILYHDDTTVRLAKADLPIEASDYSTLRALYLNDLGNIADRVDLHMPSLTEYIGVCKKYEKIAVLELKNRIETEKIAEIVQTIKSMGYFDSVIFISFQMENLKDLKTIDATAQAQFLTSDAIDESVIAELVKWKIDIDAEYCLLSRALVERLHQNGICVNCWTCDDADDAYALAEMGVDMITSNCLE